jgi:hypothetical protein
MSEDVGGAGGGVWRSVCHKATLVASAYVQDVLTNGEEWQFLEAVALMREAIDTGARSIWSVRKSPFSGPADWREMFPESIRESLASTFAYEVTEGVKAGERWWVLDPCGECGEATVMGSGRFVNRIPSEFMEPNGCVVDGYLCEECWGATDCDDCGGATVLDECYRVFVEVLRDGRRIVEEQDVCEGCFTSAVEHYESEAL